MDLTCIDARLHLRPALIPDRLRRKIRDNKNRYEHIFIAYGDCGTAGGIDAVLQEEGVERLPGEHCFQWFAGTDAFNALADEEPGTFYLTDFLARHFFRLVVEPLKLDSHPELRDAYFGNYKRVIFMSQTDDDKLLAKAKDAAEFLGLAFEHLRCGYGELQSNLSEKLLMWDDGKENSHILA